MSNKYFGGQDSPLEVKHQSGLLPLFRSNVTSGFFFDKNIHGCCLDNSKERKKRKKFHPTLGKGLRLGWRCSKK